MLNNEEVGAKEELLRLEIRELSEDKRILFYNKFNKKVKDPDTYATLNYFFVAGLHHFYLEKWVRGSLDLVLFLFGIILLFIGQYLIGSFFVLGVFVFELYSLFRSQIIVQNYNNNTMESLLAELEPNKNFKRACGSVPLPR